MISLPNLLRRMPLYLGALLLVGCATGIGAKDETIRVIDLSITASPIGWLDNDTIVVVAQSGEQYTRRDGARQSVSRLMAIDYRTREQRVFGKVSGEVCFAQGYVSYAFMDYGTDELWVSYGELGKETTHKVKPGELMFDRGPGSSCRPRSERPRPPAWVKDRTAVWPLWPYAGFLNCNVPAATVRTQYVKARFHKPEDEVGVELPFSCYEVSMFLRYYPFRRAYFSWEFDFRSPWPQGRPRRAFWLFPDGSVETVTFPYSEVIREQAIPTAAGLIAFSRPTDRSRDHGVHLVTPEGTKKILRGHAGGVTSPDGCKVSLLHDPDYQARLEKRSVSSSATLKVLELCQNGK